MLIRLQIMFHDRESVDSLYWILLCLSWLLSGQLCHSFCSRPLHDCWRSIRTWCSSQFLRDRSSAISIFHEEARHRDRSKPLVSALRSLRDKVRSLSHAEVGQLFPLSGASLRQSVGIGGAAITLALDHLSKSVGLPWLAFCLCLANA